MHYTIYCSNKLDGLAAAAIVQRAFMLKRKSIKIGGFLDYADKKQFDMLAEHRNELLFILDYSIEDITEHQLQAITKHNTIAYWNSHHPYSKEQHDMIIPFVRKLHLSGQMKDSIKYTQKKCGADLAKEQFLPQDHVAKELAHVAHDEEFWLRQNKKAAWLTDVILSGHNKKDMIATLSKGIIWSKDYEHKRNNYLEKKQHALNNLLKRLVIKKYLNVHFGIVLCPPIVGTSEAAQHMLDKHQGFDATIVLFRNGKISFRKREHVIFDLSILGKLFNGGGHDYASSGHLRKHITYENFETTIFEIDRKIKNHLLV
jgi:oligoribonuclease NrnB/cAMP/cGMP phosphodiesterase (DHH superfamily)